MSQYKIQDIWLAAYCDRMWPGIMSSTAVSDGCLHYDKGREYMPDLMPWSDVYRRYESTERLNLVKAQAPPGNE